MKSLKIYPKAITGQNEIVGNSFLLFPTDFHRDGLKYPEEIPQGQPTLDEITNKVFEELLVGKSAKKYHYSEGSCKVRKLGRTQTVNINLLYRLTLIDLDLFYSLTVRRSTLRGILNSS